MNSLVKTFCEFVSIDSPTGEERKFSDYLLKKLRDLNLKPYQDKRGNILVKIKGGGDPILLAAHIDTVQPGNGINPVIKAGVIKSSGDTILGADNKAVVASLYELIRFIVENKNFRHRDLEMLFSVSEEAGVSGIDTFDFSRVEAKKGICIDAFQPFGTIITGSPFYLSQKIEFLGKGAHASVPKNGKSVVPIVGNFLKSVPHGMIDEDTSINIGVVKGGTGANSIMSSILINSEVRSFSRAKLNKLSRKLRRLAEDAVKGTGCKLIYREQLENYGYDFKASDSYVSEVADVLMAQVGKRRVNYLSRYFGISDANNLNGKGIKTINLGYDAREVHTTHENIRVEELEKIFNFLKAISKS